MSRMMSWMPAVSLIGLGGAEVAAGGSVLAHAASAAATATVTRTLATRNELSIQPPRFLECEGANCTRASSGIHKIRVKMACSLECNRPQTGAWRPHGVL